MKHLPHFVPVFLLTLILILVLSGCGSHALAEGSEQTYRATVTDRGMSVVTEGDRIGRPYIIIATEENAEICFWLRENCEPNAQIGDDVIIESAMEQQTNLLVATHITVL